MNPFRIILICVLVVSVLVGCTSKEGGEDYHNLVRIHPAEITRFDQVGEYYFSFLGSKTIVLEDGSLIVADIGNRALIQVSTQGGYMATIAKEGRGPGEVMDLTFLSGTPGNGFIVYDQRNRKILEFDDKANFTKEFVVPPVDGGMLIEAYVLAPYRYLLVYRNLQQYLSGEDINPTIQMVIYDRKEESIVKSVPIEDALLATHIQDGIVRGGRSVDYGPNALRAFNSEKGIVYSFWSAGNKIALVNEKLDTLSTIYIDIKPEVVSATEKDSLQNTMEVARWRELEPLLPRSKAIAQDMLTDTSGNVWLLLNHRSEWNEWLVLDPSGKSEHIVVLPKRSFLTHLSENHLGVRIDDGTFALYESVN